MISAPPIQETSLWLKLANTSQWTINNSVDTCGHTGLPFFSRIRGCCFGYCNQYCDKWI